MILATLAIGGTILGVTTIAGLITLYQIRQSTDLANSTHAIFAADAGIEFGLYNFFQTSTASQISDNGFVIDPGGTSFAVACLNDAESDVDCGIAGNSSATALKSVGVYRDANRAFLIFLDAATSTFPFP